MRMERRWFSRVVFCCLGWLIGCLGIIPGQFPALCAQGFRFQEEPGASSDSWQELVADSIAAGEMAPSRRAALILRAIELGEKAAGDKPKPTLDGSGRDLAGPSPGDRSSRETTELHQTIPFDQLRQKIEALESRLRELRKTPGGDVTESSRESPFQLPSFQYAHKDAYGNERPEPVDGWADRAGPANESLVEWEQEIAQLAESLDVFQRQWQKVLMRTNRLRMAEMPDFQPMLPAEPADGRSLDGEARVR